MLNTMSKIKTNPDCDLCHGTGVAKYFDITELPNHVFGKEITMGKLYDDYGHEDVCPNCFPYNSTEN